MNRIKNVMAKAKTDKIDNIILWSSETVVDENLFYLIGMKPGNSNAVLIAGKKNKMLLVSELEIGNFSRLGITLGIKVRKLDKKNLEREISKLRGKTGINFEGQTVASLRRLKKIKKLKFCDIAELLGQERAIKNEMEISKLMTACKIAENVLNRVPDIIKGCKTENDLALKMEFEARKLGAEKLSFPVIVASGRKSAIPHWETSAKKISQGFLIVDFGVRYQGYASDMTRTFFVGRADDNAKKIFSTVWQAKRNATLQCFDGNAAKNVHLAAEAELNKIGGSLIHSISHGIGLSVHDYPSGINAESKFKLRNNMVITVEPGFYNRKIGGVRIEDMIIIKKRKCKEMSRAPRELIEIQTE